MENYSDKVSETIESIPLIALDINGVLAIRNPSPNQKPNFNKINTKKYYKDWEYLHPTSKDLQFETQVIQLGKGSFSLVPGVCSFLRFCRGLGKVCIFTSTTYPNASKVVNILSNPPGKPKNKKVFEFAWYRDRTRIDLNGEDKWCTTKHIQDILDNPIINRGLKYSINNFIICDDSKSKVRFNPDENIVIVPPIDNEEQWENIRSLDRLAGNIINQFKVLTKGTEDGEGLTDETSSESLTK